MPTLPIFTFAQWNNIQVVAAQSSANIALDFSVGSNPLALVEANSSVALYQQAAILQVLASTRAATATGADLDSFYADFQFYRLPATYTTGAISLTRSTATAPLNVAADVGISALSPDGLYAYEIVSDTGQTSYNAGSQNYVALVAQTAITATVQSQTVGSSSNIAIGSQLLIGDGLSGFDTATTVSGFANGYDAETDVAFRERFALYVSGLSRSTLVAIASAVANTQVNIKYKIINNTDPDGNYNAGNVEVLIDDGSGSAPDSLIAAVDANVKTVRGATISTHVSRPVIVPVVVSFTCSLTGGIDPTQLLNSIAVVVASYINNLSIGQTLSVTRLSAIAYNVSDYVQDVKYVTINGINADFVVTSIQIIKLTLNGLVISSD